MAVSAGVVATDEKSLGQLTDALTAAGYSIHHRAIVDDEAGFATQFGTWIADSSIDLVLGVATAAARSALASRISKRLLGFSDLRGVEGGRCDRTLVMLVPEGSLLEPTLAKLVPRLERELGTTPAPIEPVKVAPPRVSIPERPARSRASTPVAGTSRARSISSRPTPPAVPVLQRREPAVSIPPAMPTSSSRPNAAASASSDASPEPAVEAVSKRTGTPPPVHGRPTPPPLPSSATSTGRIPKVDVAPSTGRMPKVDAAPSTGRMPKVDAAPSTGRMPKVDAPPSAKPPLVLPGRGGRLTPPPVPMSVKPAESAAAPALFSTKSDPAIAIPGAAMRESTSEVDAVPKAIGVAEPVEPIDEPIAEPIDEPIAEPIDEPIDELIDNAAHVAASRAVEPEPSLALAPDRRSNAVDARSAADQEAGTTPATPSRTTPTPTAPSPAAPSRASSAPVLGGASTPAALPPVVPVASSTVVPVASSTAVPVASPTAVSAASPPSAAAMSSDVEALSPKRSRRGLLIGAGVGAAAVIAAILAITMSSSKPPGGAKVAEPSARPPDRTSGQGDKPGSAQGEMAGDPASDSTDTVSEPSTGSGNEAAGETIDFDMDDTVASAETATPGTKKPTIAAGAKKPTSGTGATKPPTTAGTTGATKPTTTAGTGAKPTGTGTTSTETVSADGCDKVSCVIDGYARACCAPFRPRKQGELPYELDRAMITSAMGKAKAAVIRCGEQHPGPGIVRLAMKITPSGAVDEAAVSEAPSPALGECVSGAIKKITFAPTETGGSFKYPFKF